MLLGFSVHFRGPRYLGPNFPTKLASRDFLALAPGTSHRNKLACGRIVRHVGIVRRNAGTYRSASLI
jgi:hypothetical protein